MSKCGQVSWRIRNLTFARQIVGRSELSVLVRQAGSARLVRLYRPQTRRIWTGVVTQHARQARLNPSSRFLCWKAAVTQSLFNSLSTRNDLADSFRLLVFFLLHHHHHHRHHHIGLPARQLSWNHLHQALQSFSVVPICLFVPLALS